MLRNRKRRCDESRLFDSSVCAFCGSKYDDELLFGSFLKHDDIAVHTYCMFFASGLYQRGEDEAGGVSGFNPKDIEAELRRGKKLFCAYCRKRGATIGCCQIKCNKSFHLPCGIEHDSLHQHFGTYASFCNAHSPKQNQVNISGQIYCNICYEEISRKAIKHCLYSPCCKKNWFHKICLQKYALSAGRYFFKCPLCNNSEEFIKEMEQHGIFIPERDASWELEENAFHELLSRPVCDVEVCQCPKGRQYNSQQNNGWCLLPCSDCGSHGVHKICGHLKLSIFEWKCQECKSIEEKIRVNKEMIALNTEVKENVSVEISASEQNDVKISDPTTSSSFKPLGFPPSSCLSPFSKHQDGKLQLVIPDIIASTQVHTENSDIYANFNPCITANSSNMLINAEVTLSNVKMDEQPNKIIEDDCNSCSQGSKSEVTKQEKQGNDLKDIKNLSPNFFDSLKSPSKDLHER